MDTSKAENTAATIEELMNREREVDLALPGGDSPTRLADQQSPVMFKSFFASTAELLKSKKLAEKQALDNAARGIGSNMTPADVTSPVIRTQYSPTKAKPLPARLKGLYEMRYNYETGKLNPQDGVITMKYGLHHTQPRQRDLFVVTGKVNYDKLLCEQKEIKNKTEESDLHYKAIITQFEQNQDKIHRTLSFMLEDGRKIIEELPVLFPDPGSHESSSPPAASTDSNLNAGANAEDNENE